MNDALYNGPSDGIDFDLVRQFVLDAEEANLFSESLTFEAKERRDRNNVVEAVAALSNTDGGIVLVGVKDKDATGVSRIVGVPRAEHDRLVRQLHDLIPTAMPEIVPVRIPETDRLIIVLRVDADAVAHPVAAWQCVRRRRRSLPAARRACRHHLCEAMDMAVPGGGLHD